jgi:hypothetical protein
MKKYLTVLLIISLIIPTFTLLAQTKSNRPNLQGYKILFEENFKKQGKPEAKDWLFRNNKKMGGVSFPANVIQGKGSDGENHLLIKFTYDATRRAEEQFLGGGLVSTHNFGYGYYETCVKLYGGKKELSGLHQSFWSMGLTGTNEAEGANVRDSLVNADIIPAENRVLEIDGFELDSKHNTLGQNYHIYSPTHKSMSPKPNKIDKDLSRWITIGYEWLPDRINYYCDGEYLSTKMLDGIWNVYAPQNFWLTALPVNLASWGGLSTPLPDVAMQIKYFKYYAKKLPRINRIGNSDFEYGVKGNLYPIAWIVARTNGNDKSAARVVTDSTAAFNGKRFLLVQNDKAYKTTVKQILEYIPNGNYTFSAYIKSSGGQKRSAFVIKTSGKEYTTFINQSEKWEKISIEKVKVKNNHAVIEIQSEAIPNQWLKVDKVEFSEMK